MKRNFGKNSCLNGSALILAVVLTSLLAVIGVVFIMVARVDNLASSAVTQNKELNLAVDTVVAKISQELVLDVLEAVDSNPDTDYYDYPDSNNPWLASLEPYESGGRYYWRQVSDIGGHLIGYNNAVRAVVLDEYERITDPNIQLADADGDGVSDSKWVRLRDVTSSKGEAVFAAIRVIDNGGMLNVNTGYKFDSGEPDPNLIDGSSQMQINLMALAGRPNYTSGEDVQLLKERVNWPDSGIEPNDLYGYETNVIKYYGKPNGAYTPFDISDELELRNRFLLNHSGIDTRLEELGANQNWEFRTIGDFRTPFDPGELGKWFKHAYNTDVSDPNYAYRHIATTYNIDRIISPDGGKMVNVNVVNDVYFFYGALRDGLIDGGYNAADVNATAAQIAVNLVDYTDDDSEVTAPIFEDGNRYYGFERPCVYISEIAQTIYDMDGDRSTTSDPNFDEPNVFTSYAIELYKPYFEDDGPSQWRLTIDSRPPVPPPGAIKITKDISWSGTRRFHVFDFNDLKPEDDLPSMIFSDPFEPLPAEAQARYGYNPADYPGTVQMITFADSPDADKVSLGHSRLILERYVPQEDTWIIVDDVNVGDSIAGDWLKADPVGYDDFTSFQRDITAHRCIRRIWDNPLAFKNDPNLGHANKFEGVDPNQIQAHPANEGFRNAGEIGKVLAKSGYSEGANVIGPSDTEVSALVNLANANFQQIFNYLTVFDPTVDGIDNDGDGLGGGGADPNELKVAGRININTAPWYVVAQLPWVSDELAKAIADYRDTNPGVGFKSIGELNNVYNLPPLDPNASMDYYARDVGDLVGFPDLTGDDKAIDDFEERDIIFHRISNLVTVRSDVFTAYILVRIGRDGPQKRVIAILDRSDVYSGADKVKVRALYPVPDPR